MSLLDDVRVIQRLPSPAKARAIREAAGISQERLAEEVGVHRVTVARWELGERHPRGRSKIAYAELLESLRLEIVK
jgi:transcriptional regulator with XRE-family HTH domain